MGVGSYFTDEFGKGSDDYAHDYSDPRNSSGYNTYGWMGWNPDAAGNAADQTAAQTASGQDRTALLNQAAGINQNSALMGNSATRIGQSAQLMGQTAKDIGGLSDQLGNAPSGAALGATAAEQVGNNQALSQAASARGANSALMTREAMSNNDARDRQIASDAGAATANEMASRATARANILGTAAGVQGNMASAYGGQASALGGAASAQTAAGNLISGSRAGDLTQRGQDMTQTQGANQLEQGHADTMYAGLAGKNAKSDADSGGALDSAFSSIGLSDIRAKTDIKKVDERATDRTLSELLAKATAPSGKTLDTSDVTRGYDRNALDAAQTRSGSSIYGAPPSRFYQPPTARFADVPPAAPAAPAAPPSRDPGYDLAALDAAYQRSRDPSSYSLSDEDTKTDRKKMLDMAAKPEANKENLDKVDGFTYRYKPDVAARIGTDTDTRPGVMAQDLEKTPAGEQVIVETPEGKGLDIHRALGFSLAGVAGLDKRLQRLEAASGGRKKKAA